MSAVPSKTVETEKTRIMLGLLESVGRGGKQSQRGLALELGVALGLINVYLKRCISKGLVKVGEAPARRYAYYLTPQGFAEKSHLPVKYLSYSFSLFRQAKTDCAAVLSAARSAGVKKIAILGVSDLAEIAAICSLDSGIVIVAVVDPRSDLTRFIGAPVKAGFDDVDVDAVLVADILDDTQQMFNAAVARYGSERVLVPKLLGLAELRGTAA